MRDLRRSLYRTWLINFRTVDLGKLNNRGMRLTVRLEVWCPWSRTVVPRITEPRMLLLLLPICGRDTSWSDRTFHTSWRICPKFYHFNGNSEIFLARFINASINEPAYNVSRVICIFHKLCLFKENSQTVLWNSKNTKPLSISTFKWNIIYKFFRTC